MSKLTGGQHIGNVLTTPLGATVRGQHTPMATAAHTTRYDLQADMVAGAIRNGDQVAGLF